MSEKINGWLIATNPPKNNDEVLVIVCERNRKATPFFYTTTTHYNRMTGEFICNVDNRPFKSLTVVLWRNMPPIPDDNTLQSLIKKLNHHA